MGVIMVLWLYRKALKKKKEKKNLAFVSKYMKHLGEKLQKNICIYQRFSTLFYNSCPF